MSSGRVRRAASSFAERRQGLRKRRQLARPSPGRSMSQIASSGSVAELDMLERAQQRGFDYEQPGAGILQDVAKLQPARGSVDRHQAGAEPGRAEEHLDELRPVLADQRDAVALAACRQPAAGQPTRAASSGASAKLQLRSPA